MWTLLRQHTFNENCEDINAHSFKVWSHLSKDKDET